MPDVATSLTILHCGYYCHCHAPNCGKPAAMILRKAESNGRPLRQIEMCDEHGDVVLARERARGLAIVDWR